MMSNTQVCTKCKIDKDLDAYHADRRTGNRKRNVCIDCRQSQRQITNISTFEYAKLLVEQNNSCAICGIEATELKRELSVDHNHETNKIRGLLCHHCNIGLGNFRDSTTLLSVAIEYLERTDGVA
jgi:hypothetical protein